VSAERQFSLRARSEREPRCIHSSDRQLQPMSMCVICRDDPLLAEWLDYWRSRGENPFTCADIERDWINR
jgi:hypothetical protein